MISFISVCESDELLEVVGHAGVLVDIVDLHLNGSFSFFFDYLHKNILSHLLSKYLPACWRVDVTQFVNSQYCSFHTDNDRFVLPACELVDGLSVGCQTSFLGVDSGEVVEDV